MGGVQANHCTLETEANKRNGKILTPRKCGTFHHNKQFPPADSNLIGRSQMLSRKYSVCISLEFLYLMVLFLLNQVAI